VATETVVISAAEASLMSWAAQHGKQTPFKKVDHKGILGDKRFKPLLAELVAEQFYGSAARMQNATFFFRHPSNTPVLQVSFFPKTAKCLDPKGRVAKGKPLVHDGERAWVDVDPWSMYLNCDRECTSGKRKVPTPELVRRLFFVSVHEVTTGERQVTAKALQEEIKHLLS
jgi:hypothetical protein